MIKNTLEKLVLKEKLNPEDPAHRTRIGTAAGIFGIGLNVLLTVFKIILGKITGSVSIVADGVNNLTDSLASIVTTAGIIFSSMPADEKHPYGHGRFEYLVALVISLGVFFVGGIILKGSIDGILSKERLEFNTLAVSMLILSIAIKGLMYVFYDKASGLIDSAPLKAAALDSIGDVGITFVVLLSYLGGVYTDFPIDGIGSLIVSFLILKGGWDMIKDMVSELLGEGLDPEVEEKLLSFFDRDEIRNVHDLFAHNYGPGTIYATIDAVVEENLCIYEVYQIFNEIEQHVLADLGIYLTIRMDVLTDDIAISDCLDRFVFNTEGVLGFHDEELVYINGAEHLIIHLDVEGEIIENGKAEEDLKSRLIDCIKRDIPKENFRIIIDKHYDKKLEVK